MLHTDLHLERNSVKLKWDLKECCSFFKKEINFPNTGDIYIYI